MKEGQYVIVDLRSMDYHKDMDGNMKFFDTEDDAALTCGMYEPEDAWILKLIFNHKEK